MLGRSFIAGSPSVNAGDDFAWELAAVRDERERTNDSCVRFLCAGLVLVSFLYCLG